MSPFSQNNQQRHGRKLTNPSPKLYQNSEGQRVLSRLAFTYNQSSQDNL